MKRNMASPTEQRRQHMTNREKRKEQMGNLNTQIFEFRIKREKKKII